jgi:outer membrane lipoprotein-sorting protein
MNILRVAALVAAAAAVVGGTCVANAAAPVANAADAALTSEQVIEKSAAARGGQEAWQKIQTIVWIGRLVSERSQVGDLPFVLAEKLPNKSRFEITAPAQHGLRVFDGKRGWKMRPGESGMPEVQPFTSAEVRFAQEAAGLEGPLVDYRARGSEVQLEGTDLIEGRKAYRLGVKLASGARQQVWVDAQTFLEVRYDRATYSSSGAAGTVSVFYRDYRTVDGLKLPSVIEIGGGAGKKPDRMIIETINLNVPLDDRQFTRSDTFGRRAEVTIKPPAVAAPPAPVGAQPASK